MPITDNPYACDKMLNFDVILKAFYPYTIATGNDLPAVLDVFAAPDIVVSVSEEAVLTILGDDVTNDALETVTVEIETEGNATSTSSLKFLTFVSVAP